MTSGGDYGPHRGRFGVVQLDRRRVDRKSVHAIFMTIESKTLERISNCHSIAFRAAIFKFWYCYRDWYRDGFVRNRNSACSWFIPTSLEQTLARPYT